MLWFTHRLFGPTQECLGAPEEAAVSRLAAASRRAANLDIKSAAGADSCAAYLIAVEAAAVALQLPPTPRSYRAHFPLNYKSLFPGEARSYRADVLEASLEHYNVIWVNGEKFEFSAEATQRAEELQCAWIELGSVLERWDRATPKSRSPERPNNCSTRPSRIELSGVLKNLDSAWASFEERYISELVQIEAKARSLIVQAIDHEKHLQDLEAQHGEKCWDMKDCRDVLRLLTAAITRLNSVANVNRKGRDDLRMEVYIDAKNTLRQCNGGGGCDKLENAYLMSAAKILATDVVDSLAAMRGYLREVAHFLERVDPHLGNNSGLVTRLVDWEESWEVGTAYLQQQPVLQALCDSVAEIRKAQSFAPKLIEMCEECDVELFMVLPRLIWLRFLSQPEMQNVQKPLLVRLLPHRFKDVASKTPTSGPELQTLSAKYAATEKAIIDAMNIFSKDSAAEYDSNHSRGFLPRARSLLVQRVISGSSDDADDNFSSVPHAFRANVQAQVESLMHELEAWSIELQRHCPEDWNQYSAVLVRCLSDEGEKERQGPFGV